MAITQILVNAISAKFRQNGASTIKLFTDVIAKAMFVTVSHFHPSLMFAGKARSLPSEYFKE